MKRREFLWSTASLLCLHGCDNSKVQKKKTICARRRGKNRYNSYSKWGKTDLTYHMLDRDTQDMTSSQWDSIWKASFQSWSDVTPLTFTHIDDWSKWEDADIVIDVNKKADGVGGKGDILAWAEMPPTSNWQGQLWTQFDKAEDWVVERGDDDDTILQCVAVHEIGHLLGLGHSDSKFSIMYPYQHSDLIKIPQELDIRAIQTLYGE